MAEQRVTPACISDQKTEQTMDVQTDLSLHLAKLELSLFEVMRFSRIFLPLLLLVQSNLFISTLDTMTKIDIRYLIGTKSLLK